MPLKITSDIKFGTNNNTSSVDREGRNTYYLIIERSMICFTWNINDPSELIKQKCRLVKHPKYVPLDQ